MIVGATNSEDLKNPKKAVVAAAQSMRRSVGEYADVDSHEYINFSSLMVIGFLLGFCFELPCFLFRLRTSM